MFADVSTERAASTSRLEDKSYVKKKKDISKGTSVKWALKEAIISKRSMKETGLQKRHSPKISMGEIIPLSEQWAVE